MIDISVEITAPLRDCFQSCEIHCVAGCCGIDAFSTELSDVVAWRRMSDPEAIAIAKRQLEHVMAVVDDRRHNISCDFLNHYTANEQARQKLIEFLAAFHCGLTSDIESKPH